MKRRAIYVLAAVLGIVLAGAAWWLFGKDAIQRADDRLAAVQDEQARLAEAMRLAAESLLAEKRIPDRRQVVKLGEKVTRLQDATRNIRSVAIRELRALQAAPPGDATRRRIADLAVALATANQIVVGVREDLAEDGSRPAGPAVAELIRWMDASVESLGLAVQALRDELEAVRQRTAAAAR